MITQIDWAFAEPATDETLRQLEALHGMSNHYYSKKRIRSLTVSSKEDNYPVMGITAKGKVIAYTEECSYRYSSEWATMLDYLARELWR